MEVVVYRNVEGEVRMEQIDSWIAETRSEGITVLSHPSAKTTTYTILRNEETVSFVIYRHSTGYRLQMEYIRLSPAQPQLIRCLDSLILSLGLSGEKHSTLNGVRHSSFYPENSPLAFDLQMRKEMLMGKIYLALTAFQQADEETQKAEWEKKLIAYADEVAELENQMGRLSQA